MNFAYNLRIIRFVYEDILLLFNKFEYNDFIESDIGDLDMRYTLKKLTNYGVIGKVSRTNGRIKYKLIKLIVDRCKEYETRYNILYP